MITHCVNNVAMFTLNHFIAYTLFCKEMDIYAHNIEIRSTNYYVLIKYNVDVNDESKLNCYV